MPDCTCGVTVRAGKGGNIIVTPAGRVNPGADLQWTTHRPRAAGGIVLDSVERKPMHPARLLALLADVIKLSDQKRVEREHRPVQARAELTRSLTAIERLLVPVETDRIGPRARLAPECGLRTAPSQPTVSLSPEQKPRWRMVSPMAFRVSKGRCPSLTGNGAGRGLVLSV